MSVILKNNGNLNKGNRFLVQNVEKFSTSTYTKISSYAKDNIDYNKFSSSFISNNDIYIIYRDKEVKKNNITKYDINTDTWHECNDIYLPDDAEYANCIKLDDDRIFIKFSGNDHQYIYDINKNTFTGVRYTWTKDIKDILECIYCIDQRYIYHIATTIGVPININMYMYDLINSTDTFMCTIGTTNNNIYYPMFYKDNILYTFTYGKNDHYLYYYDISSNTGGYYLSGSLLGTVGSSLVFIENIILCDNNALFYTYKYGNDNYGVKETHIYDININEHTQIHDSPAIYNYYAMNSDKIITCCGNVIIMVDRPYLYYNLDVKKDDIVIIYGGIVIDDDNIQKIGDITYKCLKDGVYTFKALYIPKLYMIYNKKEILYLNYEITDGGKSIEGYFLKDMKINDITITEEGLQKISVQYPLTITM